jgi:hypothetical protein
MFLFVAVPAGQYRIVATRPGYVNAEYGQRWPNGAGTPLTIPAGRAVSNIPVPMLQTGAISGRVRDRLGQPVGSADVQALKATYDDGRRVLTRVQTAVSDDRGEFRLFWLPPGRYYLSARHPDIGGGLMRFGGGTSIGGGIGPNGVARFQAFTSNGDNAAASAPLEMRQRRATERYMPVYYPGGTDEQTASALDVPTGGELTGIDFTVEPVPLQRVRGRVVYESNGEPAMSARVQWISSSGGSGSTNDTPIAPRIEGVAVECCDGSFELALAPGSYTLVAANSNINSRVGIQVGYDDIDDLVISLCQSFNIPGRVTFDGRTPTAAELSALRISLAMNPPVPGLQPAGYSTVLPNGSLTLSASRGDFRLNVSPLLNVPGAFQVPGRQQAPTAFASMYVKSIRLGAADVLNGGLHLDGQPDASLEIIIGTTPGSLDGVVVNQNHQPVPNDPVSLLPDVARRGRMDLYRTVSSDASGHFSIEHVPPGDYVAFAWDGIDTGEWQNPEFVAQYEARGTRVGVRDSAPITVELTALTPSP